MQTMNKINLSAFCTAKEEIKHRNNKSKKTKKKALAKLAKRVGNGEFYRL